MAIYDVPRMAIGPMSSSECPRGERRKSQSQQPTEDGVVTSTAWEAGENEASLEFNYALASQILQGGGWGELT